MKIIFNYIYIIINFLQFFFLPHFLIHATQEAYQDPILKISHRGAVHSVDVSSDGKRILTGTKDGNNSIIQIFDAKTGEELRSFSHKTLMPPVVAFFPDGKRIIITGSGNNTAGIFDVETGEELARFWYGNPVSSVDVSPDGKRILMGVAYSALIFDAETGKKLRSFPHKEIGVYVDVLSVAFFPDGKHILTGSRNGSGRSIARIINTETGEELRHFYHPNPVSSVDVSPDGKLILTGTNLGFVWNSTVQIFDAETRKKLLSLQHEEDHYLILSRPVAFSPDGKYVITGTEILLDNKAYATDKVDQVNIARIFDAETGEELARFPHGGSPVLFVAFFPDGEHILTGTGSKLGNTVDTTQIFNVSHLFRCKDVITKGN